MTAVLGFGFLCVFCCFSWDIPFMFGLGLAFCVCFAVSAGTSAYVWFRFLLSVYVLLFHLGHQFVFGLGSL